MLETERQREMQMIKKEKKMQKEEDFFKPGR